MNRPRQYGDNVKPVYYRRRRDPGFRQDFQLEGSAVLAALQGKAF